LCTQSEDQEPEVTECDDGGPAFEVLYRGLYPLVVRTVYLVVLNTDIAQEICHEAFLRLWQHRNRLGDQANERAWLMRVAVNLAIDHRRSLLTALRYRGPEVSALDPAAAALDRIEREEMRRALLRLRRRDRALLALRFEQDLSFPEIGRIFGRPEATVKTWVHRALDKLQKELGGAQRSPAVEEA
jgi:RNA polymerase sigma-70 factor (ECF subfamily)